MWLEFYLGSYAVNLGIMTKPPLELTVNLVSLSRLSSRYVVLVIEVGSKVIEYYFQERTQAARHFKRAKIMFFIPCSSCNCSIA